MSWDVFQRDALQELGLSPYVRAPSGTDAELEALSPALRTALVRAAGEGGMAHLARLRTLGALRTPEAKRALWPQLRRLRTGRQ